MEIGMYVGAVLLGLLLNIAGLGFSTSSEHTFEMMAQAITFLVAVAIIPEAYANGFATARVHWAKRGLKMFFWLTIGLVVRAFAVYFAAMAIGLHSPLGVASGFLATDPAAVGLSLGLVEAKYLLGLFWQLTVESLLNDAIGITVYEVAAGSSMQIALTIVRDTLLLAGVLALVLTLVRTALRRARWSVGVEVGLTLGIYVAFFVFAIFQGLSLILLSAVGTILFDFVDEIMRVPQASNRHGLKHTYEWMNKILLAVLLMAVTTMFPLDAIGKVWFGSLVLIFAVAGSRFLVSWGKRLLAKNLLPGPNHGHEYGMEVVPVQTGAGTSLLGVPTIVALELAAHGYTLDAQTMLIAIMMSWVFIPLTVMAIKSVERKFEFTSEPA